MWKKKLIWIPKLGRWHNFDVNHITVPRSGYSISVSFDKIIHIAPIPNEIEKNQARQHNDTILEHLIEAQYACVGVND